MQKFSPLALAGAIVLAVSGAGSAQAADGKQLFADKGCTACHGEDAKTPLEAGYPKLAGLNSDYTFIQLKDIKAGTRSNGLTADTMKPILEEVTEPEMKAMADYLASLGPITGTGPAGEGKQLYMTKTCVACHGKDGVKPVLKSYPAIGGQDKQYLLTQMNDIKKSVRTNGNTKAMQPVMHLVSDAEIVGIAEFLSNVK